MPTVRPQAQAYAYGGYGSERARRGGDNPCLADRNIRGEKGWKKTATVIKAVKVAPDAAGLKGSRVEAAAAAVWGTLNTLEYACRNCAAAKTMDGGTASGGSCAGGGDAQGDDNHRLRTW
eukprot:COSAG01_NODE_10_length_42970_cov_93.010007_38_plen_120_part_00